MSVKSSVVMDFARVGLAAVAFILLAKLVFVGMLKVPGLTDLIAAV